MRVNRLNHAYMISSIAIALLLCIAQVRASNLLILACLGAFTLLMCWSSIQNRTLPLLLFFIPWAPLLRFSPSTFSFYTLNLVLICVIGVIKKWRHFKRYHIVAGILLLFTTLLAKLLDGSRLAMDYICFMMLVFLFPVVAYETKENRYDFTDVVVYFSAGVILASLCAQQLATYPNIAKYIRVDSYSSILRRCGFYGDPNFFVAQVTAALSGCLILLLQKKKGRRWFIGGLSILLMYCGFLSGSKSFVLVVGAMLLIWMVQLMTLRGQSKMKITLIVFAIVAAVYISTSVLFEGLINVIMLRLSSGTTLDDFTTGRIALWTNYIDELLNNIKVLLLGKGFTNVKVNGRASHNTIIQTFFQFGVVGIPILLGWCYCFFREHLQAYRSVRIEKLKLLILLCGLGVPWLAIDILFFDEFFLWQWFMVVGVQAIAKDSMVTVSAQDEPEGEGVALE